MATDKYKTTNDEIIKVINAVRGQDCLWNVHCQEYNQRKKIRPAWRKVAKEAGILDVKVCREKWRNVRTGFTRSVEHNLNDNNVADSILNDEFQAATAGRRRYYLHDAMKFLLPSIEVLDKKRKRRKISKLSFDEDQYEYHSEEDNENTIMHEFSTVVYKHKMADQNTYNRRNLETQAKVLEENTRKQLTLEMNKIVNTPSLSSTETTPNLLQIIQHERDEVLGNREREEEQLIDFFCSNINDILGLSKQNQSLFKQKMLKLIDDLQTNDAASLNM